MAAGCQEIQFLSLKDAELKANIGQSYKIMQEGVFMPQFHAA